MSNSEWNHDQGIGEAAQRRHDQRLAILERIAKYAVEDRARTPGSTRLARALAELAALDSEGRGPA